MALVNGAIDPTELNEFFSNYIERKLRTRLIWSQFTDNRFESAFRRNETVHYPSTTVEGSADGLIANYTTGFKDQALAAGADRYGTIDATNRVDKDSVEWTLKQMRAYKIYVSTRDELQTQVRLARTALDEGVRSFSKTYDDYLRARFLEDANYATSGHSLDSANLVDASGNALAANVKPGLVAANGTAVITALLNMRSQMISEGVWSTGETPVRPYVIMPADIHAMIQIAAWGTGYNWEPIATQFATSNGVVQGLFGYTFVLDPTALALTGTERGTLVIGLNGEDSGIYAARQSILGVRIPAGRTEANLFHDVYAEAMEYDSVRKTDGAARMFRIQLKAAA